MPPDSIFKDIVRSFCTSFFRVIAIGLAIGAILFSISLLTNSRVALPHETTPEVLPNHNWKLAPLSMETPTILKISFQGTIGLHNLTHQDIFKQLIESIDIQLKNKQVKGILLYIDTPGGVADDADSIYRMLLEYKKRQNVPIYAYIEGICASGGMYIACAADKIFSSDESIVGHVGALLPTFFNFSTLMEKVGIQSATIYAGKNKDSMNPFRPWRPGEEKDFQRVTDAIYERFVNIVSQHRPLLTKASLLDQGAQVYPAEVAQQLGYIDGRLNSMDDALLLLAKEAGIENHYQFVQLKTGDFLSDFLVTGASSMFSKKQEHVVRIPGTLHPDLYGKPLLMWCPQIPQTP